ncbi:MAG: penicillin-binding protein 2 [Acidobacteriota bacterium]
MPIFQDNRQLQFRLKWVWFLFIAGFLVLLGRLWQLTIIEFQHFEQLAERNRVRMVPLIAPRGLVYDRDGRVLVDNVQSVNLVLYRDDISNPSETIDFLTAALQLEPEAVQERLDAAKNYSVYQPLVIKENLSLEEISYVLSHQVEHPEIGIVKQPRRSYRYGELAAHVLGYVGEVSSAQLETPEFALRKPGDVVGQYGLERTYDRILSGEDGQRRVLVNSQGKEIQELGMSSADRGKELWLTLDLDLQMAAEEALGDDPGAVVALDPRSGEVLAMTSRPTFDPNEFATRISYKDWNRLIANPDHPLQNRVIQATFSPGSIFKVVMALAGLERGIIDNKTSVYCGGGSTFYGHYFRCWKAGGHGTVALHQAIQQSCNVYFYHLGQKLGIGDISEFSGQVGLGQVTGIDLFGEVAGLVPSEEWKRKTMGQRWYAGETISVAIGQGPMNVTPIQLARSIGMIATGRAPSLRLVRDTATFQPQATASLQLPDFSPEHLQAIRDGMWSVVNARGTGRAAQVSGLDVCGKTGTAQTISRAVRARLSEEEARQYEPNAWFVGFAPRDHPEIVVAVIVQRGGSGGSAAAPIAGRVLETYQEKYKARRGHNLEVAGL